MLRSELSVEFNTYPRVVRFKNENFIFAPDQGYLHWKDVVDAIQLNTDFRTNYAQNSYIEVKDQMVYFAVVCDTGRVINMVDGWKCVDAFTNAARLVHEEVEEMEI